MKEQTELIATLEHIEALCAVSTPGPWELDCAYRNSQECACNVILVGPDDKPKRLLDSANSDCACIMSDYGEFGPVYYDEGTARDFEFIAAARTALPALVKAFREALPILEGPATECMCHLETRKPCRGCRIRSALAELTEALR